VEIIAAPRMQRGSSMIRECNVRGSSGSRKDAHRSSHVIMGVLPDVRGLHATVVCANTAICIDLARYASSVQAPGW